MNAAMRNYSGIWKSQGSYFAAAFAVVAAFALRQIAMHAGLWLDRCCVVLRTAIHLGLFAAWGISVRDRIIHPQVRRYLVAIAVLIEFWITVKVIRYSLDDCAWLWRGLWYLYYLPLLFIPLFTLLIAMSLGKPADFRLPRWTALLFLPTAALLLMILSNDLHQLAFRYPENASVWGDDYRYGIVYFLAAGWIFACGLAAMAVMFFKCRVPGSRRVIALPFVPILLLLFYSVCYIVRAPWLKLLAGDMTVAFCLLFSATLESCIQCGLIRANTGYAELFMANSLGTQITDRENVVRLTSANARNLTGEQRMLARMHPVFADGATQVKSKPIHFGYVVWQEDVAELSQTIAQTEENCRVLSRRNRIRQKNLETRRNILALKEKNRVIDLLNRETAGQIRRIESLLSQCELESDPLERKKLLAGAAVLGAYVKRFGNLLLMSEQEGTADIRDLARCFEDSFANLELLGAECLCTFPRDVTLESKDMLRVYRAFEAVLEDCLFDLGSVWVNARERKGEFLLSIDFACDTDLSAHQHEADAYSAEDGTSRFTFRIRKGGERL